MGSSSPEMALLLAFATFLAFALCGADAQKASGPTQHYYGPVYEYFKGSPSGSSSNSLTPFTFPPEWLRKGGGGGPLSFSPEIAYDKVAPPTSAETPMPLFYLPRPRNGIPEGVPVPANWRGGGVGEGQPPSPILILPTPLEDVVPPPMTRAPPGDAPPPTGAAPPTSAETPMPLFYLPRPRNGIPEGVPVPAYWRGGGVGEGQPPSPILILPTPLEDVVPPPMTGAPPGDAPPPTGAAPPNDAASPTGATPPKLVMPIGAEPPTKSVPPTKGRGGRHPPGAGRHPPDINGRRRGRHPPDANGRRRGGHARDKNGRIRGRHPPGVGRHPPGVGGHKRPK